MKLFSQLKQWQRIIRKQLLKNKGEINKKILKKYIPINPVIIEAGSHIGRDTVEMAKLWPNGSIYAFEPVTSIYNQLIANSKSYPNIYCYNYAFGDKNYPKEIYISSGASDGSSSLLEPKDHVTFHPNVHFKNKEIVKVITIDKWASQMGVDYVDLLWLDLQGMELSVLKASPNILNTVKVIYSEVNLIQLYDNVPLYDEFKSWLKSKGFFVQKELLPWKDAGNVLFVRK